MCTIKNTIKLKKNNFFFGSKFILLFFTFLIFIQCSVTKTEDDKLPAADNKAVKELKMKINNAAEKGVIYLQIGDIFYKNKIYNTALIYYNKSLDELKQKVPALKKILQYYLSQNLLEEAENLIKKSEF